MDITGIMSTSEVQRNPDNGGAAGARVLFLPASQKLGPHALISRSLRQLAEGTQPKATDLRTRAGNKAGLTPNFPYHGSSHTTIAITKVKNPVGTINSKVVSTASPADLCAMNIPIRKENIDKVAKKNTAIDKLSVRDNFTPKSMLERHDRPLPTQR